MWVVPTSQTDSDRVRLTDLRPVPIGGPIPGGLWRSATNGPICLDSQGVEALGPHISVSVVVQAHYTGGGRLVAV